MQVWIGTSGYSYSGWVGSFYPQGTSPARMLAYYAQVFPLVELNFPYYRLPTADMLDRMMERTPAGFQFLVKTPRSISHEQNDSELASFLAAVEGMRRNDRLAGILCQFPQAFHNGAKPKEWLDSLARHLVPYQLAVEFRHRSWFHPEVPGWLKDLHVDLVSVDVPELPSLYPRGLVQSGDRVYVRLHSRQAANWYGADQDRYDYHFDDAALLEWIAALNGVSAQTRQAFILFNNCMRGQAAANAQRLRELLGRMHPEIELVEPFAAPPELNQPLLFD